MFYSANRDTTDAMKNELQHWETLCGPRIVSCHLLHSSDNPSVDTLEGSRIEVRGNY